MADDNKPGPVPKLEPGPKPPGPPGPEQRVSQRLGDAVQTPEPPKPGPAPSTVTEAPKQEQKAGTPGEGAPPADARGTTLVNASDNADPAAVNTTDQPQGAVPGARMDPPESLPGKVPDVGAMRTFETPSDPNQIISVKFRTGYKLWNPGEVAGFTRDKANMLIASNLAEEVPTGTPSYTATDAAVAVKGATGAASGTTASIEAAMTRAAQPNSSIGHVIAPVRETPQG